MKKLHYYGSLLLLSFAGVTSSFAQTYVRGSEQLTTITPGQKVFLYSISGNAYMAGQTGLTDVTDACVYTFESAGSVNGTDTYYLKQDATGQYLGDQDLTPGLDSSDNPPSQGGGAYTWYTDNAGEAFQLYATTAVNGSSDPKATTSVAITDSKGFVFFGARDRSGYPSGDVNGLYLGYYAGQPFLSPWIDTNVWYIYEATEGSAWQKLQRTFSTYFPNGFSESLYPVGNRPGDISQEVFNEVSAVITNANALTSSSPEAELEAACDALAAAYEKLTTSVNPVVAGYYYLGNIRSSSAMYADNATNGVKWTANYAMPAAPEADDANYIWQLEDAGDGKFTIKSYAYGTYVGTASGVSAQLPLSTTAVARKIVYQPTNSTNAGGYFNIMNSEGNGNWSLNTDPSGVVVYWSGLDTDGSCWRFIPVEESALENLRDVVEQNQRNTNLENLYGEAYAAYLSGRAYSSDATKDSRYDDLGLAPEAVNLSSNASDQSEGTDLGVLVDGQTDTFWHSDWHNVTPSDEASYHWLQANFTEPLDGNTVVLKFTQRMLASSLQGMDGPKKVEIFASTDNTNFTSVGTYTITSYPYAATGNDGVTEVAGATALLGVEGLPTGTTAIRFAVHETTNNRANDNGCVYFSLSEFHVYKGAYDPSSSYYETVDATVRANYEALLATARTEIASGAATEATINALQAAYDNFLTLLPDPQLAQDAIDEAQALYDSAVEGTGIGYYRAGGKEAFQSAINAEQAKVAVGMKRTAIDEVITNIESATAAFNQNLILPEAGKFYILRSQTSQSFGTNEMVSVNGYSRTAGLTWGGYSQDLATDSIQATSYINYLWSIEDVDGLNVKLRNVGSGLYVGLNSENNTQLTATDEPTTLSLRYGRAAGLLNVVVGDGLYMNVQAAAGGGNTGNVVSWNSASGADNSAFTFEEVNPDLYMDGFIHGLNGTGRQYVCLPYAIAGLSDQGTLYKIVGNDSELDGGGADDRIYMEAYSESDVIEAGIPFVFAPTDGTLASAEAKFYMTDESNAVPEYAEAPGTQNGLIGTFFAKSVGSGFGSYYQNAFAVTVSETGILNNINNCSGYLGPNYPKNATVTSDMLYEELNTPVTSIGTAELVKNEKVDVYTITGVMLRKGVLSGAATKGLPAGIYVVGGEKVLVK